MNYNYKVFKKYDNLVIFFPINISESEFYFFKIISFFFSNLLYIWIIKKKLTIIIAIFHS